MDGTVNRSLVTRRSVKPVPQGHIVRQFVDARSLADNGRLQDVQHRDSRGLELLDLELIEDDAPAIGRPEGATERSWFEKLSKGLRLRKDLELDDVRAFAAHLLFVGTEPDNNDHPLYYSVNGCEGIRPPTRTAHPSARQYYTTDWGGSHFDNWFVLPVPVDSLHSGRNEIVLWADSHEPSWEIMIAAEQEYARGSETRQQHPNRSAKSRDGGANWDFDCLGWKDTIDGEYCVRLSLDRFLPIGVYRSPVIDLAGQEEGIARLVSLQRCCIVLEAEIPPDSAINLRVAFAATPSPTTDAWSAFTPLNSLKETWSPPPARYARFEATLRTDNPLSTPVITGLTIESVLSGSETPTQQRILRCVNGRVVRSSATFTWEKFDRLADLRQHFELDEVVRGSPTEFAAQLRLMRWAYEIPIGQLNPYAWNFYDLPQLERNADGTIRRLGPYDRRRRQGHCLHCNMTLIAACLSMGYPARWVNISTKHTYGHEVTEVWSNDFNKWIFLDATLDYYLFDPDTGIPLNLVEISNRLAEIMPGPATWEHPVQWHLPDTKHLDKVRVAYREGDHERSVRNPDNAIGNLLLKGHLQMPLRNDFASRPQPVPWRLSSNWGSDQFYCFYSKTFPRKREYQHHTDRSQDFNPSLNQAELYLSETAEPSVVRVDIDTETPDFNCFLVQTNEDPWREHSEISLSWFLHEGHNRLRVCVRNNAAVRGPESFVEVVLNH